MENAKSSCESICTRSSDDTPSSPSELSEDPEDPEQPEEQELVNVNKLKTRATFQAYSELRQPRMQLDFDYDHIGELHENTEAGLQWVPAADSTLQDMQQAVEEQMRTATRQNDSTNDMQLSGSQLRRANALAKKTQLLQSSRIREKQTPIPADEMQELLGQKVQRVIIYTDGSHKADDEEACCGAAWAFVVIDEMTDGSYRWKGFAGGKTASANQEDISRPASWVGVENESSLAAEGEAIVWAMLRGLQSEEARSATELII